MLSITTVSFIFITWRRLEKHIKHIVLVIQLSYSDSGMPVKSYYYFSMSPFWTFCTRAPSGFKNERNIQRVRVLLYLYFTIKRRYYIFSFNLKLYLLTLALENLYFNTLDREKVQGKSLGCIKSRGYTYATWSHRRWMKPLT